MHSVTASAPGKTNLFFAVGPLLEDGFHDVASVYLALDLREEVTVSPASAWSVSVSGNISAEQIASVPTGEDNLVVRAAKHVAELAKVSAQPTSFAIDKHVPVAGGMGGGSADGAFMLKMLNEVYELKLSNDELKDFARKLGSDCAFFIENRPVFCYNKGDEFENFKLDLKGKFVVLVNPDIHISTAEAYSGVSPKKPEISLKTALSQPISEWKKIVKNDFEEKLLLKYPTIDEVKETLYQSGAVYASMTGSGSTVYGIFEEESDLKSSFPSFAIWQGFFKV